MYRLEKHYAEPDIIENLAGVLHEIYLIYDAEPLFICLGSDRHILDCFGPLTGTMAKELAPDLCLYGTLDEPIHSGNIGLFMEKIKEKYNKGYVIIAVDASLGNIRDLGVIRIREGPILPGKALDKRLPPVGQIAITGIVGEKLGDKNLSSLKPKSIKHVYHMARVLSRAIALGHKRWE
ncbi:putative sporulation protein YyaC [Thermosyntropha lipolytica DSM 11003]|uniref:Putative sporulation protein YyaC n=1 Tax=Thermosyntropha lipolytica DSM 11003 TaxID=1123382 RepID=A0A1M5L8Q6_9FIRM|nr:spore protease YyaC [Thermosyntropha lipolytica]SHG61129.1 putative sporulation protein YyaC [Thermosyntropha lipolytica DSM 11003]